MDDRSLEQQIADAEAKTIEAKTTNQEMASQIADAQAIGRKLAARLQELRREHEKGMANAAYLCGLHESNKRKEREIARMEGRDYRDPDNPDGDWPEPPEPPDDL